jgi:hypothetical protein
VKRTGSGVDALVRGILDREFPGREVVATRAAARGNTKDTTLVAFADERTVVVQLGDGLALPTETALSRAVRERTTLPVPRVLAEGWLPDTESGARRPYAVAERAPGDDLHERFVGLDAGTRASVASDFGRALGELHGTFRFEGFGPVTVDAGGEFVVDHELSATNETDWETADGTDWPTWFDAYARGGVDALPVAFDDLRDPVEATLADATLPASPPSRLYPWDLRPGNALVSGGELTAFLDWGDPLAADPGLSVAKAEHLVADWYVPAERDRLRDAFRAGYREQRAYPAVPAVYRLVAVVESAVDGAGVVTRPLYPEVDGDDAVAFHREALARWL